LAVLFDIVLIAVIEFAAAIVILLISNHRAISDRTIWLQKLKTAFSIYSTSAKISHSVKGYYELDEIDSKKYWEEVGIRNEHLDSIKIKISNASNWQLIISILIVILIYLALKIKPLRVGAVSCSPISWQ
jgi:hypothetical protein